jgi:hypothetical protein
MGPVKPVSPFGPLGPIGPVSPNVTSNTPVKGVPFPVVTERRYDPGVTPFGIVAWIAVAVELVTGSGMALRLTAGDVVPKFKPVIVRTCVVISALALSMTTWFVDAACAFSELAESAKAKTTTPSANLK